MSDYQITPSQLQAARAALEAHEPRDLFYRAATELVDLALKQATSLTVAEALAVLLRTWNMAYYRFRKFDAEHFAKIEALLERHGPVLALYRQAELENLDPENPTLRAEVMTLFADFERVLGPVGTAKALHLMAPHYFPLWDRAIAQAYGLSLAARGSNGGRYWRFMTTTRSQCRSLPPNPASNPIKSIDEYNYGKFTKGWLP